MTFHNGKAFGADDVIESLQLHVAEGAKSAAKPIVSAITEMKKTGDHQVQFTLAAMATPTSPICCPITTS